MKHTWHPITRDWRSSVIIDCLAGLGLGASVHDISWIVLHVVLEAGTCFWCSPFHTPADGFSSRSDAGVEHPLMSAQRHRNDVFPASCSYSSKARSPVRSVLAPFVAMPGGPERKRPGSWWVRSRRGPAFAAPVDPIRPPRRSESSRRPDLANVNVKGYGLRTSGYYTLAK